MKQPVQQDRELSPGKHRGKGSRLERDRLRQILDSMEDLVYITGPDYRVEYMNPRMRKVFGPLKRRKCFAYLHHQAQPCSWCRQDEVLAGKTIRYEWDSPANGRTYDVIESPLHNPDGTVSKLKMMRDITELARIKNKLERFNDKLEEIVISRTRELSEVSELLERLFSSVHFLLAYLDADFNFLRVNPAYAEAYHRPPEYFVGKNHFKLFPDRENRRIFEEVLRTGRPFVAYSRPFAYPGHPEWGTTYWDWSLRPVRSARGEVEGLLLLLVDVTERRRAEEQTARAERKMADMTRRAELGTLSSMVAHEMRTPLAAIQMAAHNLRRKTSDPSLLKHVDSISRKVGFGSRVIDNLLEYSRLKLPGYQRFNILPVLRDCIKASVRSHRPKRVSLALDLGELRRVKLEADPDQIREIFANLMDNAIEAGPEDDCRVRVSARVTKDRVAVFRFKNNGPPIPERELEEVFTPFFTRKPDGTGLGLPICRELVRLHGGKIEIRSGPSAGTVVTVRLPLSAIN
jgi:PAS domain S-box-containing protein